jgi:heme/copper-type cytochrome/quinol oxidase subunit 3
MKTHQASLLNSIVLIAFSIWAYVASDTPSFTALIPSFFGIVLLIMYSGIKNENKTIAHIAVILTFVLAIALIKPLTAALDRSEPISIFRVSAMLATTIIALVFFIKSFVDTRRRRKKLA